jgi:hypothetical protein
MSDVAINPAEAAAATEKLSAATGDNEATAESVLTLAGAQTETKWGTESGPAAFRDSYSQILNDSRTDVLELTNQLSDFITAMQKVIEEFEAGDSGSATAQHLAAEKQNCATERDAADQKRIADIQRYLGRVMSDLIRLPR